jgi:hypothetical protein
VGEGVGGRGLWEESTFGMLPLNIALPVMKYTKSIFNVLKYL